MEEVRAFIGEVFRLAPELGFDPAILVAQSAEETGNWRSRVWIEGLNPAGIGITDSGNVSIPYTNGAQAARAQLVHAFAYTVGRIPAGHILTPFVTLDPRFEAVFAANFGGTVRTIADLTGKWATDAVEPHDPQTYADKIADRGNAIFPDLPPAGAPEPEFERFAAVRVFHAQRGAIARERPTRDARIVKRFTPGEAISCDGFFRGQFVEGDRRWLRTSGPRQLAIHTTGVVEPI
jgi:hypothetical protein